jgi:hypothetical protein
MVLVLLAATASRFYIPLRVIECRGPDVLRATVQKCSERPLQGSDPLAALCSIAISGLSATPHHDESGSSDAFASMPARVVQSALGVTSDSLA